MKPRKYDLGRIREDQRFSIALMETQYIWESTLSQKAEESNSSLNWQNVGRDDENDKSVQYLNQWERKQFESMTFSASLLNWLLLMKKIIQPEKQKHAENWSYFFSHQFIDTLRGQWWRAKPKPGTAKNCKKMPIF